MAVPWSVWDLFNIPKLVVYWGLVKSVSLGEPCFLLATDRKAPLK